MTTAERFHVRSAEPRDAAGLSRLFAANGFGCYCRYWHFEGTAREWLARCAQSPEESEQEMHAALAAGSEEMRGMLAETEGGEVVGWLKLAPAARLTKLYSQRLYKGLPALAREPSGTYTVACFLVREDFRRHGVARALLGGALDQAPRWGARAIEAFPRTDTDCGDAALMMGPLKLYIEAGFELVHDAAPYPVLRLTLPSEVPPSDEVG
jgi:GNAT superfamily N-acetyltransferase